MLPRGHHVQQVFYAGEDSLLSAANETSTGGKKLFIDCSTIDPDISREIGKKVEESGLGQFSDAAVSVCLDHTTMTTHPQLTIRREAQVVPNPPP